MPNRIEASYGTWVDSITRKNIIKLSLFIAVALNLDRIVLGPFAPIRVSDAFNITYPFLNTYVNNILKYGLVSQSPEWLCGVTNCIYTPLLHYVLSGLVLPPYLNYLLYVIVVEFIAFLGMFLWLQDGFKAEDKASFLGALFFASIPTYLSEFSTVAGIPLLMWSLERLFDHSCPFKRKLPIYSYVIFYFSSSLFIDVSFVIVPFYFSYLFFVSKNPKDLKNVVIVCLIFSLYLLIYLPSLSELYFHSHSGHRSSWHSPTRESWVEAVRHLVGMAFYINLTDGATYAMPSLLGLFLIGHFVVSTGKAEKGRHFYFLVAWVLFIWFFAYFIFESPLWSFLSETFGSLKSFGFKRFHYILMILYALLIGVVGQYLIEKGLGANRRGWISSGLFVLTYVITGFILKPVGVVFEPNHWAIELDSQLAIQVYSLITFLILLALVVLKGRAIPPFTALLLPLLLFSVLNAVHHRAWWGRGGESYYNYFYSNQIERVKEAEKANVGNFRVVRVGGEPAQLLQNGFNCADGYYALYPQAYKEFWAKLIEPILKEDKGLCDLFLGSGNYVYLYSPLKNDKLNLNLELLRLINVKYLFSDIEIRDHEAYGLIEVLRPEQGHSGYPLWVKWFEKARFYVYQNKEFAPPVFLTDSIRTFETKEGLLEALGNKDFSYLRTNTFVLKGDLDGVAIGDMSTKDAEVLDYQLTPDWIRVNLSNRYPVVLNWTRNYNSNWHCWVDGKETKTFRIYNSFMGSVVPANSNAVEFRYINDNLASAYVISLLGFVVVNLVVVPYLWKHSS
jgi:hypothetical protein